MNLEAFATTGSWESASEIEPKSDRDAPRVIRKDARSGSFIIKSSAMVGYRIKQEKCAMDSAKTAVYRCDGFPSFLSVDSIAIDLSFLGVFLRIVKVSITHH